MIADLARDESAIVEAFQRDIADTWNQIAGVVRANSPGLLPAIATQIERQRHLLTAAIVAAQELGFRKATEAAPTISSATVH